MSLSIVTYNVNGIRAAIKKGLVKWLAEEGFDIVCIQETKANPDQVDLSLFEAIGYHGYWNSAQKKGYSGVLTLSKIPATEVIIGVENEAIDHEGRVLSTTINGWKIINCYFPSGSSGEERHNFKMEFLAYFENWIAAQLAVNPKIIIVGDYNIVHTGKDIHNPDRRDNPSGYRPEERAWLDTLYSEKFTDSFRFLNPEKIEFSWWSYRAGSRKRNKGWRIDYISIAKPFENLILSYNSYKDVQHSDHCALCTTLNI